VSKSAPGVCPGPRVLKKRAPGSSCVGGDRPTPARPYTTVTCEPGIYFVDGLLGPAYEDPMLRDFLVRDEIDKFHCVGRAVQVDPAKPAMKAPGNKRLKLMYDGPLSKFALKFKLRRCT